MRPLLLLLFGLPFGLLWAEASAAPHPAPCGSLISPASGAGRDIGWPVGIAARVTPTETYPLPIEAYPRPADDNGRGVHWIPTNQPMPVEIVDYFVGELSTMNMKWVKILQSDVPGLTHRYLLEQLRSRDIEPILRIYHPFNTPYTHLSELVPEAVDAGVHYFELFSEPNVAGAEGGWRPGEDISVERIAELWIPAARQVYAAGGHPSLPPLAPGGTIDDVKFLEHFLDAVEIAGEAHLFHGAWIPVHNYFLNHPLDYPEDPVNRFSIPLTEEEIAARDLTPEQVQAINEARRIARLPRSRGGYWVGDTIDEDSNGFRKWEAYANLFYRYFGYNLPVIGTEGGAVAGAQEDPRYPPVRDQDVVTLTLQAYHIVLDEAPDYFFAHVAWLLANRAGGHDDPRFEHAAWYKDREGTVLPVVQALKRDPRRYEVREMKAVQLTQAMRGADDVLCGPASRSTRTLNSMSRLRMVYSPGRTSSSARVSCPRPCNLLDSVCLLGVTQYSSLTW